MQLLLPHSYKKKGLIMVPLGFTGWILMQKGVFRKLMTSLSDSIAPGTVNYINAGIAIVCFFGFLAGIYFLSFSREKIEDEFIQKTRLECFQFAAITQLLLIIIGFIIMAITESPKENGMMLFFIALIGCFWLTFIASFHYKLSQFRS
jgi:hypothetical protein